MKYYETVQDRFLARLLITTRGPGIGRWSSDSILLVGDRPTRDNIGQLPFIHDKGCAPWLAHQMNRSNIDENMLYWINSANVNGTFTSGHFIEELNPRLVIALGDHASDWCNHRDIDHIRVPHPQYWRRFRSQQRYPLLGYLK